MRPVSEETFQFEHVESGAHRRRRIAARPSWLRRAEAQADGASRAGFILSMAFLAAVALYGATLSGAIDPWLADIAGFAGRTAFQAGFRIEDLSVAGAQHTPRAELLEALQLPSKKSSLFYDTAEAHDRLMRIGWIEAAEVRRVLPSRLEVHIFERAPFARLAGDDGAIMAIGRDGHVLGQDKNGHFKNLVLFGGKGAPARAASLLDALAGHDGIKNRILRADLIAERFWSVAIENGAAVKLPLVFGAAGSERLELLLANPKLSELALDSIDLRLPHRTILQLREPTLANRDKAIALLAAATPSAPAIRRSKAL